MKARQKVNKAQKIKCKSNVSVDLPGAEGLLLVVGRGLRDAASQGQPQTGPQLGRLRGALGGFGADGHQRGHRSAQLQTNIGARLFGDSIALSRKKLTLVRERGL